MKKIALGFAVGVISVMAFMIITGFQWSGQKWVYDIESYTILSAEDSDPVNLSIESNESKIKSMGFNGWEVVTVFGETTEPFGGAHRVRYKVLYKRPMQ